PARVHCCSVTPMPASDAPPEPNARDLEHLNLLAIFHYIAGGLTILFSSMFIFHLVFMLMLAANPDMLPHPPGQPRVEFPQGFLVFMAAFVGLFVLAGWTLGILTIYSGRCLRRRKRRLLSMIVAGIQCAWVPVGTLL